MFDAKIINKIRKLLELSKDRGTTDAEAMSAMAMAQKLMVANSIEISDIEDTEIDEGEVVTLECEHRWDAGYRKPLALAMASNYRCKCYMLGNCVAFMGLENDAKIAKTAFEFAYRFIMCRSNQEYERVRSQGYSGRGVVNSYAYGFIQGLKEVLDAQSRALMIVVPTVVEDKFNEIQFEKSRGGMRVGDGLYSDIINIGKSDAKDHYATRALNA